MNVWADVLLSGVTVGALYVLVGHGFNLVYLTTHTFNFAQGQFVAMAGLLSYFLTARDYPLAGLVLIVVVVMATGVVQERLAVTPILKRSDSDVWLVSTLGANTLIQGALALAFGAEPLSVSFPYVDDIVVFAGTRQTVGGYLLIATALLVTLALVAVTRFTWTGRALRAAAEDPKTARALGINTAALVTGSFAAAAGLGAIAGIVAAPITYARADLGSSLVIQVFIVLAIGGFGSTGGLLIVGLALGVFEAFVKFFFSGAYVSILEFVLLLVALMIRPRGLFAGRAPRLV